MGLTPIPCVPPPSRQYLPGLDGELVDVTAFSSGVRSYTNFRAEITPKADYWSELLNLSLVACVLALALIPLLWWLT